MSLLLLLLAAAQEVTVLTVAPEDHDRRYVVAGMTVTLPKGPFVMRDKGSGAEVPCQMEGAEVRWLIPHIPANAKMAFVLEKGRDTGRSLSLEANVVDDSYSVRYRDREITRFYAGKSAEKYHKPFFYPLMSHGANLTRGHPMEPRDGEAKDHPHHTGIWHAFGDVNKTDYWSKSPIQLKECKVRGGAAFTRIECETAWGEDLAERLDVRIWNAGEDVVMDWTITLTAVKEAVTFGKNKEGAFSIRVATGLTDSDKKRMGQEIMLDSKGNRGENPIRADAAPWVDYSGTVDGKKVGVAILNHPSSFRAPTTWHVRAYGLFAANPWYVAGEHKLAKGESITLRYRVYAHAGDAAAGKVAEVYAGYARGARVTAE